MAHEPLSLADAMDLVRGEVGKARIRAEVLGEELRFSVGTVEVEFFVQIIRDGKDDGEIKLGVVEEGGSKGGDTHRVMFPLTPVFEPRP
ncbi:MAG: hypothetical protein JWQ95_1595 [Sphaerisporangium sp.]|nr:hypothetical protein [Sphaerisporangium sp.]